MVAVSIQSNHGGELPVTLGVNPMPAIRGAATKQRIKRLSKVMNARQYTGGGGGDDAINRWRGWKDFLQMY